MADSIGEAYVTLRPDTKGFEGEAHSKIGGALGSVAKVGVAAFAGLTVAAGAFGVKAVLAAGDLGETMSKTTVVFKEATPVVTKMADDLAKSFGLPKQQILDAAGGIGLVLKASGQAAPAVAATSAQMAKLAADASSFYNVPLPDALAAIKSGLVGESEPLRAYGILLSEAAVQQEAVSLGIAKAGEKLTEQQKVMARSSLITKGFTDASGDLERTQDSLANQLRKAQGTLSNMAAELGQGLIPAATGAISALMPLAGPIGKSLADVFAAVAPLVTTLATNIGAFLGPTVQALMPGLTALLKNLGVGLTAALQGVGPLVETFSSAMGDVLVALAPILPVLGRLVGTLAGSMIPILEAITPMMVRLVEASLPLLELLSKIAEIAIVALTPGLAKLAPLIFGIILAVKAWAIMQGILNAELSASTVILLTTIAPVAALVAAVAGAALLIVGHWDAIKNAFGSAAEWIGNMLAIAWQAVTKFVATVGEWFGKLPGLIGGAIDEVVAFLADLPAKMAYWAGYAVGTFLRFFIDLPGQLWNALTAVFNTIVSAVPRIIDAVVDFGRRAVEGAVAWFAALPGYVANAVSQVPGIIGRAAADAFNAAKDFGARVIDGGMQFIRNLPNLMGDIAGAVIDKLKGLARDAFNAMKDWAANLWAGFKKGLGIGSPSLIEDAMTAIVGNVNRSVDQLKTSVGQMGRLPTGDFGITGTAGGTTAGGMLQINLDGETLARVVYDQLLRMERRQGPLFATT